MTATVPLALERLTSFLAASGGAERFDFHDGFGEPDPIAARGFAERMREQLGDHCGQLVAVRQHANRVVVSLLDGSAAAR